MDEKLRVQASVPLKMHDSAQQRKMKNHADVIIAGVVGLLCL